MHVYYKGHWVVIEDPPPTLPMQTLDDLIDDSTKERVWIMDRLKELEELGEFEL